MTVLTVLPNPSKRKNMTEKTNVNMPQKSTSDSQMQTTVSSIQCYIFWDSIIYLRAQYLIFLTCCHYSDKSVIVTLKLGL